MFKQLLILLCLGFDEPDLLKVVLICSPFGFLNVLKIRVRFFRIEILIAFYVFVSPDEDGLPPPVIAERQVRRKYKYFVIKKDYQYQLL